MDAEKVKKRRRKRRKRSKHDVLSERVPSCAGSERGHQQSEQSSAIAVQQTTNKPSPSQVKADSKGGRKRPRQEAATTNKKQQRLSPPGCPPKHPFEVDATDHCETPLEAYRDIVAVLDQIARSIGKSRSTLSIYDPYFCDGGVKEKLRSLGFHNVTNENKDFYKAIQEKTTPQFDVLVTNPPYSGTHVEKLLSFVVKSRKPFLLLLPHYVYTKEYYQQSLGSKIKPFFLVPKARYSYLPPAWVKNGSTALVKGKVTTSPFPSFWYCHAPVDKVSTHWLTQTFGASGIYRHDRRLHYANCTAHIPRDVKGEFDATKKRPNPKARKRAAAKKRAALATS